MIERYSLDNGLDVILHQDHDTPKVAVTFLVKTGSKDEPEHRSGFAHLFEHLMFMGTRRVPQGEYDRIIESYGGTDNAFTTPDMTVFYSEAPARALPTLLWLEADRLDALGANIDQRKLDLQRDVVLNERRQTTEDEPYGEADEAQNQLLYPENHPYHRGTIGSPVDLRAATVGDVQEFFATNYVPNNITLVVSGNFSTTATKTLVKDLFGPLPRRNDVERKAAPGELPTGLVRVNFVDHVTDPRLSLVWRIPSQSTDGYERIALASEPLSSRLNATLVDNGLASSVSASVSGGVLESTLTVTATPADGTDLDQLESALLAQLTEFRSGITDAELQGAKTAEIATESESAQDLVERSITIATDAYYFNDPYHSLRLLDGPTPAGRAEVNDAIRRYLDLDNHLVMTVRPDARGSSASLSQRPPDLAPAKASIPAAVEFRLKNGMNASYWQVGRFGTSYLELVANQGSGSDPVPGTTDLLAALLDQGAKTPNFDLEADRIGASVSASASATQLVIATSALSRNLKESLALTREVLEAPLMTQDEFETEQTIIAQSLDARTDDPRTLSYDAAVAAFYGTGNSYGAMITGSQVRKVALDDVVKRRGTLINPKNLQVVMAGDLDPKTAEDLLNQTIGAWKAAGDAVPADIVPAPEPAPARLLFIDTPGSAQTMVRVLTPAVKAADPASLEYDVLGTILGGTFTSRLNTNLREDKGYTYGVDAAYEFDRNFGFLNTRTSVDTAVTGKAVREILREFDGVRSGVTGAEVVKAVQTGTNAIIDAYSTPESLVQLQSALAGIGDNNTTLLNHYARLSKLTVAAVDGIASDAVDTGHALWVLVGDRDAVLPQLTGLGLPKPEFFKVPK